MAARVLLGWAGSKGHTLYGHPECAGRAVAIEKALAKANLLTPAGSKGLVGQLEIRSGSGSGVTTFYGEDGRAEKIGRVHSPGFVSGLRDRKVDSVIHFDVDTYATETTYSDLLRGVDVSCRLVDEVVAAGGRTAGFGLIRPPGHHSVPTSPMGFCVFNQISTAVRHAQVAHQLQRVAVLDFDVHHGNGTQDIFYDDPDVLVSSSKRTRRPPPRALSPLQGQSLSNVNASLAALFPRCSPSTFRPTSRARSPGRGRCTKWARARAKGRR